MIYFKIAMLIAYVIIAVYCFYLSLQLKKELKKFNDDSETTLEESTQLLSIIKKFIYILYAIAAISLLELVVKIFGY